MKRGIILLALVMLCGCNRVSMDIYSSNFRSNTAESSGWNHFADKDKVGVIQLHNPKTGEAVTTLDIFRKSKILRISQEIDRTRHTRQSIGLDLNRKNKSALLNYKLEF